MQQDAVDFKFLSVLTGLEMLSIHDFQAAKSISMEEGLGNLSAVRLTNMPCLEEAPDLTKLTGLQSLHVDVAMPGLASALTSLGSQLTSLSLASLGGDEVTQGEIWAWDHLEAGILCLPTLQYLSAPCALMDGLPENFSQLFQLTYLDLMSAMISVMTVSRLASLTRLDTFMMDGMEFGRAEGDFNGALANIQVVVGKLHYGELAEAAYMEEEKYMEEIYME